jgi:hypothetical protein
MYLCFVAGRIDPACVDREFGRGRNGVRKRAFRRFSGGCIDQRSFKSATAKLRESGDTVHIIWCKCTSSMKAEVYSVYLVVTDAGVFLPGPSRCDCPVGCLFYSQHASSNDPLS